jgi:hypothetical protein
MVRARQLRLPGPFVPRCRACVCDAFRVKTTETNSMRSTKRALIASRTALLGSVIIAVAFHASSSFAAVPFGFKASGVLESWVDTKTNSRLKETCRFEASVFGNSWLLTFVHTNGQSFAEGCDGRDVYWLFNDKSTPATAVSKFSQGLVTEGIYPLNSSGGFQSLPWLAFCSAGYFSVNFTNGAGIAPTPWRLALMDPLARIYSARFEALAGSRGLPASIDYQPDKALVDDLRRTGWKGFPSTTDSERDKLLLQLDAYYGKINEPEGVYTVLNTTNIAGQTIPSEFQLQRFVFTSAKPATTNGILVKSSYGFTKGRLLSVEEASEFNPFPVSNRSTKEIRVADYRVADESHHVEFVKYTATEGAWITNKGDPRLVALYKGALAKSAARMRAPKFPKELVGAVVLFLFVVPLCSGKIRAMFLRRTRF